MAGNRIEEKGMKLPEGINPADTLALDFWPPEVGRNTFLLSELPSV